MTNRVTVRFMKPGEEETVCALVERVFDAYVAPDFAPEGIEEFYRYAEPDAMAKRSAAGDRVIVAEEGTKLVGMLELAGTDHIAMLFVETPGGGIGRKLVTRALDISRNAEPKVERITVHSSRYAVPIYQKLGFVAQGAERTENGITYLPMALDLAGDTSPRRTR